MNICSSVAEKLYAIREICNQRVCNQTGSTVLFQPQLPFAITGSYRKPFRSHKPTSKTHQSILISMHTRSNACSARSDLNKSEQTGVSQHHLRLPFPAVNSANLSCLSHGSQGTSSYLVGNGGRRSLRGNAVPFSSSDLTSSRQCPNHSSVSNFTLVYVRFGP